MRISRGWPWPRGFCIPEYKYIKISVMNPSSVSKKNYFNNHNTPYFAQKLIYILSGKVNPRGHGQPRERIFQL